ncbi:MAG: sulfurtransferase, partial [Thiobacillus sp.]|nr:sulfurtransferase [Thiobacillus sp.]
MFRPADVAAHIETGHTPVLLDVREPWEWNLCRLPGAILIPMRELPARLAELNK